MLKIENYQVVAKKLARYGVEMAIYQLLFFLEFTELARGRYLTKVTSDVKTFNPIKIPTRSTPQNKNQNVIFVKDKHTYDEQCSEKFIQRSFIKSLSC